MDVKSSSCYINPPSDVIEHVRKTFDLDKPGRITEAVNILHEWIQKQDHLIKKDFSADYLERTLITCKGSVEKAKKQIDRLCTMRTLMPKFFSKSDIKTELPGGSELAWVIPLPQLTEDYYRVQLLRFKPVKNITSEMILKHFQYYMIVAEYIKAHEYANGFIMVLDFRDLNLLDMLNKLNASDLQQLLNILIKGYGARIKSINQVTESTAVEILIAILKPLLSGKLRNRLFVQKNLEDLYKVVPKEILPKEYGGNEKSFMELHEKLFEEVSSEKHVEYMKMMNKACSDESKRREGKFNEEYLGMPGTFRSLSVD